MLHRRTIRHSSALSLAAVSQACGAIMAVLLVRQGWPALLAVVVALLAGTIIGLVNGFF